MSKETPRRSWFKSRVLKFILLVAAFTAFQIGSLRLFQPLTAGEVNSWVGWSQKELVHRLGQPEETHDGAYVPIKAARTVNPPDDPRRTLHFKTWWGHVHLWVWLRRLDGRWVCYASISYPDRIDFWTDTADLWLEPPAP